MSLPRQETRPDRRAAFIAHIRRPAGILLAILVFAAFSVGMYSLGVRVGEEAIGFDKNTAAAIAAERTRLVAENKILAEKLKHAEDRFKQAEKTIKDERSAENEYTLKSNETLKISGFPTIIGMVGTSIANVATLSFENTRRDVRVGDRFTTHVGAVEACEVTVRAVDVFSVKLRADCKIPPQN